MKNSKTKRSLSVLIALIMLFSAFPLTAVEGSAQSKDEVPEGYKGIYTIEDLYCINDDMDGKYILMNDIDLTEATAEGGDWDFGGRGWNPIGSENIYSNTPFTGEFDGNNHSIIGMRINVANDNKPSGTSDYPNIGLFSVVDGSVHNLNFSSANITITQFKSFIGCLCGEIGSQGKVNYISIDSDSSINCNLIYTGEYCDCGSICGKNNGLIENCSAGTNMVATAGKNNNFTYKLFGGICGGNSDTAEIRNCFFYGSISEDSNSITSGAICPNHLLIAGSVIDNCYNVGTGFDYAICKGDASNCYYLTGTGGGGSGATELTTAQMKLKSMYRNFDFDNIWIMSENESYPYPIFKDFPYPILDTLVSGVSFAEKEITLYTGDTKTLEYTVLPENATDKTVSFESSDTSVASIDNTGKITALKKGSAIITVTTTDGSFTDTCSVEVLCPHKNTTVYPQVSSTCNSHGHAAYTLCNDCGEVISGDNSQLPLLNHKNVTTVITKTATCTEEGSKQTYCLDCGTVIKTDVIPAKGHKPSSAVTENEIKAKCNSNGSYDSVVYCSACGEVLNRTTVIIPATGHKGSSPVRENERTAGCTTDGYYDNVVYCSDCNAEISRTRVTIPATGHKASAAVKENEKKATCTADGYYDNVVYCSDCGSEISRTRVTIPATGHSWNESAYTWSDDNLTCTATRTCKNDSKHVETETVNTTSEITVQPTTTSTGKMVYTAEFKNEGFKKQTKTVTLDKLPDTYKGFPDVKKGDWYYDVVKYVAEKGFITGYQNGKFGPNDSLKRQDFVCILARIDGADLSKYANQTSKLTDVKKGDYYAAAVNWAVDKGYISGYKNGKFGVNDPITREQVATILYNYMNKPEVKDANKILAKFPDANKVSSFAKTPVAWAVDKGIISGMGNGTVASTSGATRAQIAAIIQRMDTQGMFSK